MKAILVMEMPKSCDKCPLFSGHYSDMACRGNGGTIDYPYPDDKVQDWCPLVPMPERKEERCGLCEKDVSRNSKRGGEKTDMFAAGFNACLDAIEGREEDG